MRNKIGARGADFLKAVAARKLAVDCEQLPRLGFEELRDLLSFPRFLERFLDFVLGFFESL